jgi:hypothetical protein
MQIIDIPDSKYCLVDRNSLTTLSEKVSAKEKELLEKDKIITELNEDYNKMKKMLTNLAEFTETIMQEKRRLAMIVNK